MWNVVHASRQLNLVPPAKKGARFSPSLSGPASASVREEPRPGQKVWADVGLRRAWRALGGQRRRHHDTGIHHRLPHYASGTPYAAPKLVYLPALARWLPPRHNKKSPGKDCSLLTPNPPRFAPTQPNAPRPNRSYALARQSPSSSCERSLDLHDGEISSSASEHTPRRKAKPLRGSSSSQSPPAPESSALFSPRSVALNERHRARAGGNIAPPSLEDDERPSLSGMRRELSWDILADSEDAPPAKAARFISSGDNW